MIAINGEILNDILHKLTSISNKLKNKNSTIAKQLSAIRQSLLESIHDEEDKW